MSAKAATGIAGLDGILQGGLPAGMITVVTGGPGSGKTVLAMHVLMNGARLDEPGVMISFEESAAALLANAASFARDDEKGSRPPIHFVDGRPLEDAIGSGAYDLSGLIAVATAEVRRLGARRIALDGLDTLLNGLRDDEARRRELRRLFSWVESQGLTGIVTLKPTPGADDRPSAFDDAEYLAGAVIRLSTVVRYRLVERLLRVLKVRGASFSGGKHAFVISQRGVHVDFIPVEKIEQPLQTRRLSTGVDRLDRMLSGGLRAGTITLISGLPGTAKTTLASSFLAAGLKDGERALLIAFDEPAEQVLADVCSVGTELARFREAGLLRVASFSAGAAIAEEHYLAIEQLVHEHHPSRVVIDPITALQKAGGPDSAAIVGERLAYRLKSSGITGLFTAVANSEAGDLESTSSSISTIADTWMHLSYAVIRGERNRTLAIVKSRGTGHSNQIRELLLSDRGITLQDVDYAEGELLLGTARLERQLRLQAEARARERQLQAALDDVNIRRSAVADRIADGQSELAQLAREAETLTADASAAWRVAEEHRQVLLANRAADPEESGG